VIRGSAINNDGSSKVNYFAPSVDGQAAVIAEALAVADVTADTIDYVETHGTGTPLGDPIEVTALTQAFRVTTEQTGYCGIASVLDILILRQGLPALLRSCRRLSTSKYRLA
jgi:acyl transferase domain-containing protein